MSFTYRTITANCGNDTLGNNASNDIHLLLQDDKADFFVLNCQETHFEKTQEQLRNSLPDGYQVKCLKQMPTHTKWDTQLRQTTGMATFVIYKDNVTVDLVSYREARRNSNRINGGSGYNKGGLVTHFTVTRSKKEENSNEEMLKEKPVGESITVQAVTGHLDANDVRKRNEDWHVLYRKTIRDVDTWEDLVAACPHLSLLGYDANTRNRLDDNGVETNMWDDPDSYPEIQALHHVSLGGTQYRGDETYNHTKDGERADPKRPGYTACGSLDIVTVFGQPSPGIGNVIQLKTEFGSARDHDVVISPMLQYASISPFERVKNQMASHLQGVAPALSGEIRKMKETPENQTNLINIYKQYLGPNGYLDKTLDLHRQKLECFKRLNSLSGDLKKELSDVLFDKTAWYADEANQKLMLEFLKSLSQCEYASGVEARLDCYRELKARIAQGAEIREADKLFKQAAVDKYKELYNSFKAAITSNPNLQESGEKILGQLDVIANFNELNELNPVKLDKMTHLVAQCHAVVNLLNNNQIDKANEVNSNLMELSHTAMGSASPAWCTLAKFVEQFANSVVFVISKISSNLSQQVKAGSDSLEIIQNKRLSSSIIKFKSELQELISPEKENDEGDYDTYSHH